MKKSSKTILVSLVGLGLAGGAAFGHGRDSDGGFRHGDRGAHMVDRMSDKLDLGKAQEDKLQAVFDQLRAARRDAMRTRHDDTKPMLALLDAPRLDQDKALALFNDRTAVMQKHAPKIVAAIAAFTDGLTPEQKTQAREMLQKHPDRQSHKG